MGTIFLVTLTLLAFVHTNNVTERKAAYTGQDVHTGNKSDYAPAHIVPSIIYTPGVTRGYRLLADTPKKEDDTAEHLRT